MPISVKALELMEKDGYTPAQVRELIQEHRELLEAYFWRSKRDMSDAHRQDRVRIRGLLDKFDELSTYFVETAQDPSSQGSRGGRAKRR